MKKNALPVLIIVGLIVLVLIFLGVSAVIEQYTPTDERQDLSEYYNITEETPVSIILDNEILDNKTMGTYFTSINGEIYLDYDFVYDYLNSRFYWDSNENILLYTTATDIISAPAESTSYLVGKSSTQFGKTIVKATAESALIHIDFVSLFSNIRCEFYEAPTRVVITSQWGDNAVATAKNNTQIRVEAGIKSPILADVTKGTTLTVLEEANWTKVATADGIIGYVESKNLSKATTQAIVSDKPEETFSHIQKDKPINLVWHLVTNTTANSNITSVLSDSKGVNVVSPTWFDIKDNDGNITSIASTEYVDYCHSQGVEVWALIANFEEESANVDTSYVLTHTSARQNLVNQLVAKALQYNLDGINIDLESMNGSEIGDGYIQFLRELSIKCKDNDLVLSTDVAVPAAYNYFYRYEEQSYFVDYIIIMGYDQHTGQRTGEGSVASLDWTEEAVTTMLNEHNVPADQIVLGIPFYSKLWSLTPRAEENSAEVTYVIGFENLGMTKAKKWMTNNVEEPVWLEESGQYYGETQKDGVIYKMWLEDTTSLEKRLQMLTSHNLAGAAFWQAGQESSDVWDVIIKYIN